MPGRPTLVETVSTEMRMHRNGRLPRARVYLPDPRSRAHARPAVVLTKRFYDLLSTRDPALSRVLEREERLDALFPAHMHLSAPAWYGAGATSGKVDPTRTAWHLFAQEGCALQQIFHEALAFAPAPRRAAGGGGGGGRDRAAPRTTSQIADEFPWVAEGSARILNKVLRAQLAHSTLMIQAMRNDRGMSPSQPRALIGLREVGQWFEASKARLLEDLRRGLPLDGAVRVHRGQVEGPVGLSRHAGGAVEGRPGGRHARTPAIVSDLSFSRHGGRVRKAGRGAASLCRGERVPQTRWSVLQLRGVEVGGGGTSGSSARAQELGRCFAASDQLSSAQNGAAIGAALAPSLHRACVTFARRRKSRGEPACARSSARLSRSHLPLAAPHDSLGSSLSALAWTNRCVCVPSYALRARPRDARLGTRSSSARRRQPTLSTPPSRRRSCACPTSSLPPSLTKSTSAGSVPSAVACTPSSKGSSTGTASGSARTGLSPRSARRCATRPLSPV
ncbi:hypothetical protein DMC30DRAFT_166494 [Rhodotorula diobovata]|uniref:Uncharacterized protein n=1 Tax=Rhodotorula diobovata TaxID=5288 RepID=A0A5C5G7F4_9BASI|nr:hypothetical protein DMC30DRAFT_166494 [Rhodotorula diobovata]